MVPAGIVLATSTDGWHQVLHVIDGDTVAVDINDTDMAIRLLRVSTPKTVDPRKPVECFGPQASDEAKKLLTDHTMRLETDASQGKLDKYGRTLAYVFSGEANSTNFDKFMLASGDGREYTYNKLYKYQEDIQSRPSSSTIKQSWTLDHAQIKKSCERIKRAQDLPRHQ
jgi:micrococcal nuclease